MRITRLITHDEISARLRAWFARRDAKARAAAHRPPAPNGGAWWRFITCPWCVSVHTGLVTFGAYGLIPGLRHVLAYVYAALTASLLSGLTLAGHSAAPAAPSPAPSPPSTS